MLLDQLTGKVLNVFGGKTKVLDVFEEQHVNDYLDKC